MAIVEAQKGERRARKTENTEKERERVGSSGRKLERTRARSLAEKPKLRFTYSAHCQAGE